MEGPGDLEFWSSLYFVPVIGVFALAGAVYYLSFRSKDDDNQSLRIYLNVLSGDDDKNRKAAKKLRKFGTTTHGSTKRVTALGCAGTDGDGDSKQVKSDTENRAVHANALVESHSARKPSQQSSSKKADPPVANTYSSAPTPAVVAAVELEYSPRVTPSSRVPEVVTLVAVEPAVTSPVVTDTPTEGNAIGWHKAVSRKEKKYPNNLASKTAEDATNHSTTSDESRPSFRNSNSSRNSSPYRRIRMTQHDQSSSSTYETRKFSSRKTLAKPPQVRQRPDHLKLEPLTRRVGVVPGPLVSRPTIVLSKAPEAVHLLHIVVSGSRSFHVPPRSYAANDYSRSSALPPGQTDVCIQTEENEDYPTPLQGLRQVDAGKPRFVICHDFQVQVDLDVTAENGSESESELRFEGGDKILYSSGASLSSGEGSSRVTPVLEDEYAREFSTTAEKSQGVHQRNPSFNRTNPRQSPVNYSPGQGGNSRNGDGKRGGGDAAAYYVEHNDLRSCRVEKGSSDWIDNSSRRGRAPANGRWRN